MSVAEYNRLCQKARITQISYTYEETGQPHNKTFLCHLGCRYDGTYITTTGKHQKSKREAKKSAIEELMMDDTKEEVVTIEYSSVTMVLEISIGDSEYVEHNITPGMVSKIVAETLSR